MTEQDLKAATRVWKCLDNSKSLSLLVTGPDDNITSWGFEIWPDWIDRRKRTARCRVWFSEPVESVLERCRAAAKKCDVTLQLLCDQGPDEEAAKENVDLGGGASVTIGQRKETYPLVHLGSHKKRWGKK